MSQEAIRQAVTTKIEAAKAGFTEYPLVIEYENLVVVDTAVQQNPFLCVKIKLMDGSQVDLSNTPTHRVIGQIHLAAATKDGTGTASSNRLLDWFYPQLHRNSFGGIRTYMAKPAAPVPHLGWTYRSVIIPFWYDSIE